MAIHSYAAFDRGSALEPFEYDLEDIGPHDVEVQITHCGVCHTDLHLIDNDWGISSYPLVPGHEIVGTVRSIGEEVLSLEVGQRVGIGWQRGACLSCELCASAHDNLCPNSDLTCVGNFGGFASAIRADSRYTFPIPDLMTSENAAPLLCAGATAFAPFRRYIKGPMSVAVIGIGGLGHLALQFANALGCEVTAISSSPDKEREASLFGAHHFLFTDDETKLRMHRGEFDFILSTVFADLDWGAYVELLKPNGTLCFVGAAGKPISIPAFDLISAQRTITGSAIGSRAIIQEMLEFAARHQIQAQVEVMPMTEANLALERVRKNHARYRVVLANTF